MIPAMRGIVIKNPSIRAIVLAVLQVGSLWAVIRLWLAIGPYVGFPGLMLWMFGCYRLADWLERDAEQRWMDELERRGWRPPPPPPT
jgi:hypothetical protein